MSVSLKWNCFHFIIIIELWLINYNNSWFIILFEVDNTEANKSQNHSNRPQMTRYFVQLELTNAFSMHEFRSEKYHYRFVIWISSKSKLWLRSKLPLFIQSTHSLWAYIRNFETTNWAYLCCALLLLDRIENHIPELTFLRHKNGSFNRSTAKKPKLNQY